MFGIGLSDLGSFAKDYLLPAASSALAYKGQQDTNRQNLQIARETNQLNWNMAQRAMDFSSAQSSTAYQRARADMEAAGLNPILAASQGGASTPSGSTGNAVTGAPMQNAVGVGVSSARDFMMFKESLNNLKMDSEMKRALMSKAYSDATLSSASAQSAEVNRQILQEQLKGAKLEGDIDSSSYGKAMRYINRVSPLINSAGSLVNTLKPKPRPNFNYNTEHHYHS